jgi:hypothetical protein
VVKVEVEAHELRNGSIEKLSLVTHGAIRQPFKIIKTEEIDITQSSGTSSIKRVLSKVFGEGETAEPQVAALFVRKEVARQWIPLIKKHGFRVEKDHASLEEDIVVLKQEGYSDDCEGSVIALNPNVAVQLVGVSKFFDPFPASSSFSDNVAAGSFWPGMHNAMESLAETVWNVLNESESPDDAVTAVGKQVKAFSSHLNNLVAELPSTVFKMEQESLTKEFEGSTLSTSSTITDNYTITVGNEGSNMSTVEKTAPASDLDGLFDEAPTAEAVEKADEAVADETAAPDEAVEKGGDEGAPKTGGSPGNPVVENTSDTGAVSLDEGGVPAGFRKEERAVKKFTDGKVVDAFAEFLVNDETKEEIFLGYIEKMSAQEVAEAPVVELTGEEATIAADEHPYTPAELKLFEAMGVLAKSVTELKEVVEKQEEKIEAVTKTADEAKEIADETVVMAVADDLDNSLATLRGKQPVLKREAEEEDIFKGLLPQIEGNAA